MWTCNLAGEDKTALQQGKTGSKSFDLLDSPNEEEGLALASLQDVEVWTTLKSYLDAFMPF